MIRNRGTKDPLKIVRQLDAFPKIPEEYKVGSRVGGFLSVVSRILIVFLIYTEIQYYLDSKLVFKFQPDHDMDAKLTIHIDVTVATPCKSIGSDILDSTNQNVFSFGLLEEDDTWWDLSQNQRNYFQYIQHMNDYLREEYHSLSHVVFKNLVHTGDHSVAYNLPEREDKPTHRFDACRIHGTLILNKVSGNLHVIGGKTLHLPQGHIHISSLFDEVPHNFSHRINRFSFGDATAGIVHPLEGDEKIFHEQATMAQYFIEVVPTEVHTMLSHIKTFQYSVKENIRPISHSADSHGIPGLYFKYDVSALKVIVKQDREHIFQFIVRLSSIIAGIIVISGILNTIIQFMVDFICSYFQLNSTKSNESQRKMNSSKTNLLSSIGGSSNYIDSNNAPNKPQNLLFTNATLTPPDATYEFKSSLVK